jgi:hypothetical protein
MTSEYEIEIQDRCEVLKYTDDCGVYYFNGFPSKGVWTISIICQRGDEPENFELNEIEKERIVPRLKNFIESKKRFGIFGTKYKSKIVYDPENY